MSGRRNLTGTISIWVDKVLRLFQCVGYKYHCEVNAGYRAFSPRSRSSFRAYNIYIPPMCLKEELHAHVEGVPRHMMTGG